MFGDADLPAIFGDWGFPVIWNGSTITGMVDVSTDIFQHGSGPGSYETTQYVLHLPRPGMARTPKPGEKIIVPPNDNLPAEFAPGTYTVKELQKCPDPSIVDLILKGPSA